MNHPERRSFVVILRWSDELFCGWNNWVSRFEMRCVRTRWPGGVPGSSGPRLIWWGDASGVANPKIWGSKQFWGAKILDFRRITLFCWEKRFSKHKMTIFSKHLGGNGSFAPPCYAYGRCDIDLQWTQCFTGPYCVNQTFAYVHLRGNKSKLGLEEAGVIKLVKL